MDEKRKITWVHGTKGGVGKSLFASVLVDYDLARNIKPIIVEGDGGVPDVGRRYEEHADAIAAPLTGTADALYEMFNAIESVTENENVSANHIIVNLPANSEVIDAHGDDIAEITEELGYINNTIFMIAEKIDSAKHAGISMRDGLCSVSEISIAVPNLHFGNGSEGFAWEASQERAGWIKSGRLEMPMPGIAKSVLSLPALENGPLYLQAKRPTSRLKIGDRQRLRRWLEECFKICEALENGGV